MFLPMFFAVFWVGMFVLILWGDFLRKRLWFFGLVVDWVAGGFSRLGNWPVCRSAVGSGLIGEVWFVFFGGV